MLPQMISEYKHLLWAVAYFSDDVFDESVCSECVEVSFGCLLYLRNLLLLNLLHAINQANQHWDESFEIALIFTNKNVLFTLVYFLAEPDEFVELFGVDDHLPSLLNKLLQILQLLLRIREQMLLREELHMSNEFLDLRLFFKLAGVGITLALCLLQK